MRYKADQPHRARMPSTRDYRLARTATVLVALLAMPSSETTAVEVACSVTCDDGSKQSGTQTCGIQGVIDCVLDCCDDACAGRGGYDRWKCYGNPVSCAAPTALEGPSAGATNPYPIIDDMSARIPDGGLRAAALPAAPTSASSLQVLLARAAHQFAAMELTAAHHTLRKFGRTARRSGLDPGLAKHLAATAQALEHKTTPTGVDLCQLHHNLAATADILLAAHEIGSDHQEPLLQGLADANRSLLSGEFERAVRQVDRSVHDFLDAVDLGHMGIPTLVTAGSALTSLPPSVPPSPAPGPALCTVATDPELLVKLWYYRAGVYHEGASGFAVGDLLTDLSPKTYVTVDVTGTCGPCGGQPCARQVEWSITPAAPFAGSGFAFDSGSASFYSEVTGTYQAAADMSCAFPGCLDSAVSPSNTLTMSWTSPDSAAARGRRRRR